MNNKLTINFDFDGCLIDSIKAVGDTYFNRHYAEIMGGLIPTPFHHCVRKWDFTDEYPLMDIKELDSIFQSEEFFNNASFITDPDGFSMKDLFEELIGDDRFHVLITTKGTKRNLELKYDFIKKEFPQFNMNNFVGMLGTEPDKSSLEGWLVIDDVVKNHLSATKVKHKMLFAHRGITAEWNENYINHKNIMLCVSVRGLCDRIIELYNFEKMC